MKIYLDAGHGGYKTGATANGRRECDETLKMEQAVEPLLVCAGHKVLTSRNSDTHKELADRVNEANSWGADLFVSIHLNSYVLKSAKGTECLIVSSASATSKRLAQFINTRVAALGFTNRGVKVQDINTYVLKKTSMPATTVEICFISNPSDMALYDAKFIQIGQAIANGVCDVAGGVIKDNQYTYTATKETPLLQVVRILKPGETVELESYFTGDVLARVEGGQVVFADFKK
jgi:N-acetylmuramoyl-L-alanine amidase